ncbi:MAG: hypothetical protein ABIX11_05865 [Casimicrobiaceae bacterium]
MMSLQPRQRCDYSAIVDRPRLTLPGDARIEVLPPHPFAAR